MFDELFDTIVEVAADAASAAGDFILETVKENGPHIAHAAGEVIKTALK